MDQPSEVVLGYGLGAVGLLLFIAAPIMWDDIKRYPVTTLLLILACVLPVASFFWWKRRQQAQFQRAFYGVGEESKSEVGPARDMSQGVGDERQLAEKQQVQSFRRNTMNHGAPSTPQSGPVQTPTSPSDDAPMAEELKLLQRWVRIAFSDDEIVWAFVYVDAQAGLSAKGDIVSSFPTAEEMERLVERPGRTIRLQPLYAWDLERLSTKTCEAHQLPSQPSWYREFFAANDPSRWFLEEPLLRPFFDPAYPGDIRVIVYDGGPRCSDVAPEAVWVRVTGRRRPLLVGEVLNQPFQLKSVQQGDQILFAVKKGLPSPFQLKEAYLEERDLWRVSPCDSCGLDELFDPPSRLISTIFPDAPAGATPVIFTSFCPMCGGVQQVKAKDVPTPI